MKNLFLITVIKFLPSTILYLGIIVMSTLAFTACEDTESTSDYHQSDIEKRVESIVSKMTIEDKVGQMTQITLDVITKGENVYVSDEPVELDPKLLKEAIEKYRVGSILNTANNRARDIETWNRLIKEIQDHAMKELAIPVIYGIDAIHGTTYTAGATFFPQQIGMAATWNTKLNENGANITALETRLSSLPWNFSPVLDMGRDPRWPRMWETYGEDVYLVSEMGKAAIKGYEGLNNDLSNSAKVSSCVKHFLGYGAEKSGKDRTPTYIPEIELREHYLPAYKAAIDAGAHTVMINSGIINGVPVHANYELLTTLLRDELGFKGVAVTDWADIDNIYKRDKITPSHKEAVKLAINAGIDMAMVPYHFDFTKDLIELVKDGEVSITRIDEAVSRIIKLKLELNLFEKPYPKLTTNNKLSSKESEQSAYLAASESITLLKNEKNILPISKGSKILVSGPNANSMRTLNGGWSYSWQGDLVDEKVFTEKYNTILEAVENKFGNKNVNYIPGVEYIMDGNYQDEKVSGISKAVKAAKNADYILLCLGENSYTESVGNLNDLNISENQEKLAIELARTGKPIILVLNEGRPRLIRNIEAVSEAILQTYLPGNFGADALVDILTGKVNPSGKLPYTYPKYPNALSTYDYKPSEALGTMEGGYDYSSDSPIQYKFGFGLSYTTFEYSKLIISKGKINPDEEFTVSVKVKNTGKVEGKEVVQLYTKDLFASVTPDNKRLRRFAKINLKAGEEKTVEFKLNGRDLAFVGADLKTTVEKGDFKIIVGKEVVNLEILKTEKF